MALRRYNFHIMHAIAIDSQINIDWRMAKYYFWRQCFLLEMFAEVNPLKPFQLLVGSEKGFMSLNWVPCSISYQEWTVCRTGTLVMQCWLIVLRFRKTDIEKSAPADNTAIFIKGVGGDRPEEPGGAFGGAGSPDHHLVYARISRVAVSFMGACLSSIWPVALLERVVLLGNQVGFYSRPFRDLHLTGSPCMFQAYVLQSGA